MVHSKLAEDWFCIKSIMYLVDLWRLSNLSSAWLYLPSISNSSLITYIPPTMKQNMIKLAKRPTTHSIRWRPLTW